MSEGSRKTFDMERVLDGWLSACKVTFGSEPGDKEEGFVYMEKNAEPVHLLTSVPE